jgi:hypothetical protein
LIGKQGEDYGKLTHGGQQSTIAKIQPVSFYPSELHPQSDGQ